MKKKLHAFITAIFIASCLQISAQIGAVWTSPTTGTLDGVPFTITNLTSASIMNANLSGSDFSAAPLSNSQQFLNYREDNSDWTITFDSPVNNLRLYLYFWRVQDYVFTSNPTMLSGTAFSISGNTITVTSTFGSGIVEFPGNTTTLSVTHVHNSISFQGLTFGLPDTLGINDNNLEDTVKLYPNPIKDDLTISLKNSLNISIEVYDMLGRQIIQRSYSNQNTIPINIEGKSGVYFVKVTSEKGSIVKKIIKR